MPTIKNNSELSDSSKFFLNNINKTHINDIFDINVTNDILLSPNIIPLVVFDDEAVPLDLVMLSPNLTAFPLDAIVIISLTEDELGVFPPQNNPLVGDAIPE